MPYHKNNFEGIILGRQWFFLVELTLTDDQQNPQGFSEEGLIKFKRSRIILLDPLAILDKAETRASLDS